jgi:hypothetical protein
MHFTFRHMALLLIILYLCIPVMGFAHVNAAAAGVTDIRPIDRLADSPCDHCPCSDEQGSHCCDTSSCSCAFHSPSAQGVQVNYAPVVIVTRHDDSFWFLPQVYSSIFVPPQNRSSAGLSDVIEHEAALKLLAVV